MEPITSIIDYLLDLYRHVQNSGKNELASRVFRYVVRVPDIARKAKPGQFVILRIDEAGERIPITIADMNPLEGTITLYVQVVGKTTYQMSLLKVGDEFDGRCGSVRRAQRN